MNAQGFRHLVTDKSDARLEPKEESDSSRNSQNRVWEVEAKVTVTESPGVERAVV